MSDKKQDQNSNGEKKASSGKTLSLKGLDPKALQQNPSPSAGGPLIEHKRRRPAPQSKSGGASGRNMKGGKSDRYGSGQSHKMGGAPKTIKTLSQSELDARQRALSMAHKQSEEDKVRRAEEAKRRIEADAKAADLAAIEAKNKPAETEAAAPKAEEPAKKKHVGPKILGQLKPEDYMGKSRSHLAGRQDRNQRDDNNRGPNRTGRPGDRPQGQRTDRPQTGRTDRPQGQRTDRPQTGRTDRPQGQRTDRPQTGRTDRPQGQRQQQSSTGGDRPSFSNQRADFASAPTMNKPSPSRGAKAKPRSHSDDYSNDSANKAKLAAQKERPRKLTVTNADKADEVRNRSVASYRRKLDKQKKSLMQQTEKVKVYREVIIPDSITVQELASRMSERSADVVKELMKLGIMATLNKALDADTAELLVETLGHTHKRVSEADVEVATQVYEDSADTLKSRAPVVTIMGHVDHGKTSLLDVLRSANVVAGEAGGITQHIGAYQVRLENDKRVTFIDTPGHAAFSEMRARGARATDIVILVVAADDGIMPQTIEAIKHAKASNVPMIVAINKIDKPGADPDKIRADLLQHEVVVESMSGEVMDVEVSAKERINLKGLLDAILLQSEMLELKANPDRFGEGVVIEAELDKGRGAVATFLVQHGRVNIGDIVVAGAAWGRVRALVNDLGERVTTAGPSVPVEILGLGTVPLAGDSFMVVENDARAREISEYREHKLKEKSNTTTARTLDNLMSQIKESEVKSMPIVIKGDVQGSVEAISAALEKLGNEEVRVQVVFAGAGGVTESDVNLAETAGGIVVGFNVRANKQARDLAEQRKVEIRYYSIIYNIIDDVKAALSGMLPPEIRENLLGNAEILEVFNITRVGNVAGCRVRDGLARRSAKVRLIRDSVVIHEGTLSTLRRFKDEVKEVQQGYECGMAFEKYQDMRAGDMIEIFEMQEIERHLD